MDWRFHRQACLTLLDYYHYVMLQGSDMLAHIDRRLATAWRKGHALLWHHDQPDRKPFIGASYTEIILAKDQDMGQLLKYILTAGL